MWTFLIGFFCGAGVAVVVGLIILLKVTDDMFNF